MYYRHVSESGIEYESWNDKSGSLNINVCLVPDGLSLEQAEVIAKAEVRESIENKERVE